MHKAIYILILVGSIFCNAKAQEKSNVEIDSVVQSNKSSNAEGEESLSVDSSLIPNHLTIPADSVERWKNLSAFAYARYLDSLLRIRQEANKNKKSGSSHSGSSSSSTSTPQSSMKEGRGWFDNFFTSRITNMILWALAALFIAFILYQLFLAGDGPFKKRSRSALQGVAEVAKEELTRTSDFDSMIGQSVRQGNYRLAIRYQYLKLLHRLEERHFIEIAVDKTNYQYVRELSARNASVGKQFRNDFASLTLNYEYVWYGEFAIDDAVYRKIETGFNQFNQKI